MTCAELFKHIESWAPKEIAWQNDNVGLQVGSSKSKIKNILLSLDLIEDVIKEALAQKCNLIITHHPLLFHPLKKIAIDNDSTSQLVQQLLTHKITLYSAHTNLDYTKDGVSFQLAKQLELKNIKFLEPFNADQIKVVIFIPPNFVEKVSAEIFKTGAGTIGEYNNCSFRLNGEGTFIGSNKSSPVVGLKGKLERVEEVRIEIISDKWNLKNIIEAIKKNHPYEEPAFDIYPIENENKKYGAGSIGFLEKPMSEKDFLKYVSKKLSVKDFRFTAGNKKAINRVAVCGGSGSDLIKSAMKLGADAFITADVRYHTFHEANKKMLLIDAGHYETEIFVLHELQKRITQNIFDKGIKIFQNKRTTNPIEFYNN
ncbi:MAG: Nif3-like dinuclear metal center hexameric protein [Ignavibacteriales bacterium]|nr:Nif3-like dinuclear metal center hexameric protein [Ignavibacteriales bacterium]